MRTVLAGKMGEKLVPHGHSFCVHKPMKKLKRKHQNKQKLMTEREEKEVDEMISRGISSIQILVVLALDFAFFLPSSLKTECLCTFEH